MKMQISAAEYFSVNFNNFNQKAGTREKVNRKIRRPDNRSAAQKRVNGEKKNSRPDAVDGLVFCHHRLSTMVAGVSADIGFIEI